ncbi:hypothetical protein Tco_0696142, partial [Tanacetum coccineum]
VPEVCMHQFQDAIHKYDNSYRFRMDKKKKFDLNLEIFKDIFQICPRVHGQNFDELPTNEDIVSFFKELGHTGEIKSITVVVVDQMHQPWRTFATIINRSLSGKTTGLDKLRLSRAQIFGECTIRRMWTMLNYFGKISLTRLTTESMTSPEMRETKAYKTYLGYATGVTLPKKARKFKKPASPKLTTAPVLLEEPTRKSKRVKRPAKKSTNAPTVGVVIRDTLMMAFSKKTEKVTVEKRKGINLLSEVALTEEAQYKEVRKKSLRDFHKTHPSGSGTITKIAPSAAKIKPSVTNEGTGAKPGVPDVTEEESNESEVESWGRNEDDNNNDRDSSSVGDDQESDSEEVKDDEGEKDDEFVKTSSISIDDETNDESKDEDKAKGDEDKGMDYTNNQFNDDVNQGNENPEILINQVIEDAHVTIFTVPKKTEVPVTSSSHSSDLASKFLKFSDIPFTDAEIVSPMDVHVHHEVPSNQTPILLTVPVSVVIESSPIYTTVILQSLPSFTLPSPQSTPTPPPATEATNPPLTALVDEHLDSRLGATRAEFINYLSASITTKITEQVKIQLPQILSKEVSNFAPPLIKSMVTKSLEHAVLAKESSQPKSTYEAATSLTEFELKKILIDIMDESQSYLTATEHKECYDRLIKSDRGLKKRKTSKDAEPTKGPKTKESKYGSDVLSLYAIFKMI